MTEQVSDWLKQALNGDDDAYTCLVETFQKPVYNLCCRMLFDPQDAEDAAQETFWRAYQSLKSYDPQRSFITWLLSIAAHYCIDLQRKRRLPIINLELLPEEYLPDGSPSPEKSVSEKEENRIIQDMLRRLNPKDRATMILYYWYELSIEEIGQALSLSTSAVKSRLHRARLELARNWKFTQSSLVNSERRQYDESHAF